MHDGYTQTVAYAEKYDEASSLYCVHDPTNPFFVEDGDIIFHFRTLYGKSGGEWDYLFNTRTVNGGKGAGYSYVNNTSGIAIDGNIYNGVFLFPDDYTGTIDMSALTWTQINDAGIVFLPAAGKRSGSAVSDVGGYGYYWSYNTDAVDKAFYSLFQIGSVTPDKSCNCNCGLSIRLVMDADL